MNPANGEVTSYWFPGTTSGILTRNGSMIHLLSITASVLHPDDPSLSERESVQVQQYRLSSLLAAVLLPVFGTLYSWADPQAVDPAWIRLALSGLLLGLFVGSYLSDRVCRNYVPLT
ncbi:hypothetical protein SRU_1240 [Salinibacter ruber DSM 13855]|uniref:Uncharacterized protein n=1 Tax=Salinibacter ruber (strain DSM 13855 / M31) TaxID=309807 RepID=Q2S367_SALRD|nr:hypothetical protein SRU_1240 [Salinibacter ruber DSM 13855]